MELRHPIGVHEDFDETSGGYSEGVHENFHNYLLVCWFGSLEQTWPGLEPNLYGVPGVLRSVEILMEPSGFP